MRPCSSPLAVTRSGRVTAGTPPLATPSRGTRLAKPLRKPSESLLLRMPRGSMKGATDPAPTVTRVEWPANPEKTGGLGMEAMTGGLADPLNGLSAGL